MICVSRAAKSNAGLALGLGFNGLAALALAFGDLAPLALAFGDLAPLALAFVGLAALAGWSTLTGLTFDNLVLASFRAVTAVA
jgi:hypothetical protein